MEQNLTKVENKMPETSMIWNLLLSIAAGSIVWWIRGINSKIDDLYRVNASNQIGRAHV